MYKAAIIYIYLILERISVSFVILHFMLKRFIWILFFIDRMPEDI